MINYIKGILIEKNQGNVVVDVNGIAYDVSMPQSSILPHVGEEVIIYAYLAFREDAINLYGFNEKEDKYIFLKLLSVNGVGPRNALCLISSLGRENLMMAIAKDDKKAISMIKGIGEKTASRIIIDLKDKLDYSGIKNVQAEISTVQSNLLMSEKMKNVIESLVSLGFQKTQAKEAILASNLNDAMTEEEMLKKALHNISKNS